MEIRLVKNEEFLELARHSASMYSAIDPNINSFQAVNTLVSFINSGTNFQAIGLYDEDKMIGMVTGVELNKTTFYFTGIYMSIKNNEQLQKLIDFSFSYIKELGYIGWEVDATNANISSIMEKYGAVPKYVRYHKEFE